MEIRKGKPGQIKSQIIRRVDIQEGGGEDATV